VTDGELRVGKGIADFQLDPPDFFFVENELEHGKGLQTFTRFSVGLRNNDKSTTNWKNGGSKQARPWFSSPAKEGANSKSTLRRPA
jgi:hypothetical protein